MTVYTTFVEKFAHIRLLRQIERLLQWDYETCMPISEASVAMRAKQMTYVSGLMHQEITHSQYRTMLSQMVDIETGHIQIEGLTPTEASNVKMWSKDLLRVMKLPQSFVETFSATKVSAVKAWKEAKKLGNFSVFTPWLQAMVDLNRKKADLLGYAESPYDALVDLYEPAMTAATLSAIFGEIVPCLSHWIPKKGICEPPDKAYFDHAFSPEDQAKFNQLLLSTINIPSDATRLDLSAHPFCMSMHPRDVRMTTNLEGGLLENIFAVLHEGGHALYELGFAMEASGTPAAEPISLGIHESQSRWWEIMVGKSLPFWNHMYPKLQSYFPQLQSLSLANFYAHINHVTPSYIRIYADEITYPLHIILRFEIEKQLIEGTISASDLPNIWNARMEALLGIIPPNDTLGCLQDIHWASGHFGYFPTYALGNIYAAQYFSAFAHACPNWEDQVASGSFLCINDWLRENIHQHGRMYDAQQSMQRITGSPMSVQPYIDYLTKKYEQVAKLR